MQEFETIKISEEEAQKVADRYFDIQGNAKALPGEIDFNFKITSEKGSYILKISRPDQDLSFLDYQQAILGHLNGHSNVNAPEVIRTIDDKNTVEITDEHGNTRFCRMLTWMNGRLWSSVNPISVELRKSLGIKSAELASALIGFDHPHAHKSLEWDVAKSGWTTAYLHLFSEEDAKIVSIFQQRFTALSDVYNTLPKSVIHADINDNNILVSNDLINPNVCGIIDFGDAVFSQTINDLAVVLAYACMHQPDPLSAAQDVIRGYIKKKTLSENEIASLHTLTAMRLIITVTKSALNKKKEPENTYHQISEKPAWDLLRKWIIIHPDFANYAFRKAAGLNAHPSYQAFTAWAANANIGSSDLFPTLGNKNLKRVDMSVSSQWLGHESEYEDLELTAFKIKRLQQDNPDAVIAGGYGEIRPFYSTDAYKVESNNGPEYRTVHLGIDFWVDALTPLHTPFDGEVVCVHDNDYHKDYGPTIILKHSAGSGITFYTLYGHLSQSSLTTVRTGQQLKKGDLIGSIGKPEENGNWVPHLHFQVMLDLLGNKTNFPGVAAPNHSSLWKEICPDPNLFFQDKELETPVEPDQDEILSFRRAHLGKSLSLSYAQPLKIVRGSGAFLIDASGRKFLDTVNNVAHVGHEHPRVIEAGKKQMSLLNTNTRYLHENINAFAKSLLQTMPDELSVVHFVNSGSEANELAMRMAKAVTGQKDFIAVEIGYHGNSNGCIDISSYKFDGKGGSGAPEHTHIVPLPDAYRGLYQGNSTGKRYAQHVQEAIESISSKGRKVAAFICESIISCGGQIELPNDYLLDAYQYVRDAGGVCIADEVQVGCGRMGTSWWGFQLHEIVPDIVTIGKPLGNGHPLAAVVCTQEVAEAFANGMEYFNTFGGNPVSSAIGKSVLEVIKEEQLMENALKVGNYLLQELKSMQRNFPIIGEVRGKGLFIGFELVDQEKSPLPEKAAYLANRMRVLGVLMSTDGKDNNVLKLKPPMVFSMNNADELLKRLKSVFQEDFMTH